MSNVIRAQSLEVRPSKTSPNLVLCVVTLAAHAKLPPMPPKQYATEVRAAVCDALEVDGSISALIIAELSESLAFRDETGAELVLPMGTACARYSSSTGEILVGTLRGEIAQSFDADNVPDGTPGDDAVADEVAERAATESNMPRPVHHESLESLRAEVALLKKAFSIDPARIVQAYDAIDASVKLYEALETETTAWRENFERRIVALEVAATKHDEGNDRAFVRLDNRLTALEVVQPSQTSTKSKSTKKTQTTSGKRTVK